MGDKSNYKHYENISIMPQMDTLTFEAESIAAVVSSYFGIDTSANSWGYVASWSRNKELPELTASLQVIKDTAGEIITGISEEM